MGQMTLAVIYGCDQTPPDTLEEGWYSLIDKYNHGVGPQPDTPHGDGNHDIIGFWVAVGASGEDGVPDLDEDFPLDGLLTVLKYNQAYRRAVKAWAKFAAWAEKKRGIKLDSPRLWLAQTEVA